MSKYENYILVFKYCLYFLKYKLMVIITEKHQSTFVLPTYIYVHKFVIACTLKMIELHVHIKLILQLYSEYFINRIYLLKYVVWSISILFRNMLKFCHFFGILMQHKMIKLQVFSFFKNMNFFKHFPVEVE